MKVQEKIRHLRTLKGRTQENMAEFLDMSVNGYANIERGDSDVKISRLEQIATLFDMKLLELMNNGEGQGFFLNGNNNTNNYVVGNSEYFKNEIEKLQLQLEHTNSTIESLKKEILHLEEINELLKK
jgi:transcriptional regulator with XRE-family HTH domain